MLNSCKFPRLLVRIDASYLKGRRHIKHDNVICMMREHASHVLISDSTSPRLNQLSDL